MTRNRPTLSLVIPLYNEEATAKKVAVELVEEMNKQKINYELILVNNGSRDRTGYILAKLAETYPQIKTITVPVNQGYGWGVINGLKWANGEYLGFMGGDGQIDPKDVTGVFNKILEGDLQLCKAKRCRREDGAVRKIVSHIFNKLFVYTFKVNVGDINGTPKIMTRKCYERLNLSSKDWFLDAEVMLKVNALAAPIGEIPVVFRQRQGGSSNVKIKTVWEFLRNMASYRKRRDWNESGDIMWREGDPA
ncbi:glycosyltransferase family 2 protein [Desulforamulus aquiferis]|uniref:Glycosyltransferase family 2 protein n=1 Tax=Desulforamulus aquiferis TaxID=1397668 RepID=A0AAW7ZCK7_9FIRM|nr:glycosyltransferase family 2 protein [Desulforamulus aquiferis]MDO7787427.1 glycosyltransferase family 2 protein [Desulforamulus aquiferis]RYD02209.1 hypothetical protein N752_26240 [Desulforamulus aquiferis]